MNDSVADFFLDNSGDPLAEGTEWWASLQRTAKQKGAGAGRNEGKRRGKR